MDNETKQQIQQETLRTIIKWQEVVSVEYYRRFRQLHQPNLRADIMHSVLLQWMLDGNEPLPKPPPKKFSNPWHQLVVDGEGVAMEVWSGEAPRSNQVIINQHAWDILERTETGYIATYGDGTTKWSVEPIEGSEGVGSDGLQWQLKRIEDD